MSKNIGFKKYEKWLKKYKGNCEDLSLNIFIKEYYKTKPIEIKGKYFELDNNDGYSSNSNHYKIRNKFCKKYYI